MLFAVPTKKALLNLRLRPEVRDDFAIAAELRGATMSGLLHQFIVRTIREEKEACPEAFRVDSSTESIHGRELSPASESGIPLHDTESKRKKDAA